MGTGSFPGVKRPGRDAEPPPHLQWRGFKKGTAIPLPNLRVLVAYTGGTFFNFSQMFGEDTNLNANDIWNRQIKHKYEPFSDTFSVWKLQILL